jgi:hypothetical protein
MSAIGTPDIAAYLAALELELADLAAGERSDQLEEVEASLLEIEEDPVARLGPPSRFNQGIPVNNIFVYDVNGKLLRDVRLYDSYGQPLNVRVGDPDTTRRAGDPRRHTRVQHLPDPLLRARHAPRRGSRRRAAALEPAGDQPPKLSIALIRLSASSAATL